VTALVARLEGMIALAAMRRAVWHPTRRLLWSAVVAVALGAAAVEIATSGSASRDLGSWAPSPVAIVAVAGGIVAIAALFGRRTTLTYGTRAADATWWRYAGIDTGAGQRATTAILATRMTAIVVAIAAPAGALFAVADPDRTSAVVMMALAAIAVAPLVVLASSATASRTAEARSPETASRTAETRSSETASRTAETRSLETVSRTAETWSSETALRTAEARSPETASRTVEMRSSEAGEILDAAGRMTSDGMAVSERLVPTRILKRIPRGLLAARWLVARRRREPTVPFASFVAGLVAGVALPAVAARAGGQATALAVVIGGFALLTDGALRRTTAPATLLAPWWRAALGTSAPAIVAWALADAFAVAAFGAGTSLALGTALRTPLLGLAAVPLVVLAPVALRVTALGVDSVFPGDRRGPGAFVRVAVVGALTVLTVLAALGAGARGGLLASLAAPTAVLLAIIAATAEISTRRLAASA
jgi:hypothetical protein